MPFMTYIRDKIREFLSPKVTPQDIRIRHLIWIEFNSDNNCLTATRNICRKLGRNAVSIFTVSSWYYLFNSNYTSLFDKDTPQSEIVRLTEELPNEDAYSRLISIISSDTRIKSKMITERFVFFSENDVSNLNELFLCDFFQNRTKKIKITPDANYGNIYSVKMIGQHYLLIAIDIHLYVLKINYDSFELSVVSDIPNIFYASYTVDQTDSFSFIAYNSFNFVIGNLVENELVLSPRREFNFDNLKLTRLVNNQLIGFHIQNNQNDADVWLWQLSEINLTTLTAKTTDVPFTYNVLRDLYSTTVPYCWAGNKFYVSFVDKNSETRIFKFEYEALSWIEIGITVYGWINALFVDENHFLTMQTTNCYSNKGYVYRFALKKPDSLKNIAWFSVRCHSILFNGTIYEKVRDRFSMIGFL